jgi:hypothetical protein
MTPATTQIVGGSCGCTFWSRITSQRPVTLRKIGENEYRGTFYLDRMQDKDYYGPRSVTIGR